MTIIMSTGSIFLSYELIDWNDHSTKPMTFHNLEQVLEPRLEPVSYELQWLLTCTLLENTGPKTQLPTAQICEFAQFATRQTFIKVQPRYWQKISVCFTFTSLNF